MQEPTGDVVLTVAGGVATITITREAKRNALAQRHFVELVALLDEADADDTAGVIVLTGAGERAFCAGADISKDEQFFETIGEHKTTGLGDVMRRARTLTKPLLGRINGHCYAGGVGLLSACDIAIAADDARFALAEVTLGLFPFIVIAGLQPKLSASAIAELALTGAPITAPRAAEIGLVSRCVPRADLNAAVTELASKLAALPRTAMKAGRPSLSGLDDATFESRLAAAEARTFALSAARSK